MPEDLTDRQRAALEFIVDRIREWGYPPTIREIGNHLDISSTNGVNDHLKALERKGYLERGEGKSRALRPLLTPSGNPVDGVDEPGRAAEGTVETGQTQAVPLVGRIAAGSPREAIENTDEYLGVGAGLVGRHDDVFALEVTGESMIEEGIFDGDYIFVRPQRDADNGDIVAAMVDGEATVKRFYRQDGRIRLQPANESMEPIYIDETDGRNPSILGRVIGVFRQF